MSQIHWLNAINGSFTNPSDWSGGAVPGASDDAILDAVGSAFTVTSGVDETVESVQLASNATLSLSAGMFTASDGTGAGANAGIVLIGAGATMVAGGTVANSGAIVLNGGKRGAASLRFDEVKTTLSGGGEVLLDGGLANTITTAGLSEAFLYNTDNTIVGSGTIARQLILTNQLHGTIDAGGSAALVLKDGVENAGLVEATGSGGLAIDGGGFSGDPTGVILAGAGSFVFIQGSAEVAGGTLESIGSGSIVANGAYLAGFGSDDLVVEADLQIRKDCHFAGTIENNGTISESAGDGGIFLNGAVTLEGDGDLDLGGGGVAGNSGALTLASGTISGPGGLEGTSSRPLDLTISAAGLIDDNAATSLTIDTYASIANAGTIEAAGKGAVVIEDAIVNSGTFSVQGGGTIEAEGAVSGDGVVIVGGGTVDFLSSVGEAVTFTGFGTLALARSQKFTSPVTGFSAKGKTTLDLGDIKFVDAGEATFSGGAAGGVLTVTDGTHTASISLEGHYLNATFVASSDGHGGTDVVAESAMAPAAAVHAFVSAMAALGSPAGEAIHTGAASPARERLLTSPRVAIA